MKPTFYEFFAGGGMARAGLGSTWKCLFANDFDHKKAISYQNNWSTNHFHVGDVRDVTLPQLPGTSDLIWASFPCQDLSLAGGGAGLRGERSGTFWPFWDLVKGLRSEGRGPKIMVLENVYGTLRSHGGKDFASICKALSDEGFRFGPIIVDAAMFVPQSRPRLFIIAISEDVELPTGISTDGATEFWHPKALVKAWASLDAKSKHNWIWWDFEPPPPRTLSFSDIIEAEPGSVRWHSQEETAKLIEMMGPLHLKKLNVAKLANRRVVGTIYKRTRVDDNGFRVQRAEIRFDDIAGCLRTPAGGSSRQVIMEVNGQRVRSRLISSRETARLMGLKDSYILPKNYNEAYHLTGDGVVVPVVRHLSKNIFEPILKFQKSNERIAT